MVLSKARQSVYAQLSHRKMRDRHGRFIVEGRKGVEDTIGRFEVEAVLALPEVMIPDAWRCADSLCRVSQTVINKISSLSTPSDVLAVYRIPEGYYNRIPVPDETRLYLMLDGVRDPGNLGTIIRTAHWFGIDRIYASKDTVDVFNPKTIQSTMGSLGKVDIIYCDLESLISENPGMPVYGTLLNGENIYKSPLGNHGFILMGNEGKGISMKLRERVTFPLLIPPGNVDDHSESLNVAIATAVTLSEFRSRQFQRD